MNMFLKKAKNFGWKKLALVAVVLLGAWWLISSRSNAIPVSQTRPERKNITKVVNSSGKTDVEGSFVVYSQVTGNIKTIAKQTGEQILEGEAILELDPASLKATADTALASYLSSKASLESNYSDILSAQADVKAKKQIRDRRQELYNADNSFDNREDLKTAEANYQAAQATLLTLQNKRNSLNQTQSASYSSYLSAKQNLSNTSVVAQSTGILALENIQEGQQITTGQRLFSVIAGNALEFKADVDESDVRYVKVGQTAKIKLDSYPEKELEGKILSVAAKTKITDNGATAVEVKVQMSIDGIVPIIGLNGEVNVEVANKENALSLPIDFLDEDNTGPFVWIEKNGKAEKARITLGLDSDVDQEILSGIDENTTVIKGTNLKEGVSVKKAS